MTEDIQIRLAAPSDAAALVPLVEQYWRYEAIEGFNAARVSALLEQVLEDSVLGRAWIATVGGVPAGYLLAVFVFSLEYQGVTAEIDELFVVQQNRKLGLGGRLLDAAEAHFRNSGCTHAALQIGRDNEAARAFYQRRGFSGRNGLKVNAQLARIEATRAHLRGVHLDAHLEQTRLLNAAQIARYSELRDYSTEHHGH